MDKSDPCDFFNVFPENYVSKSLQESSSSANILVSTELSLSSTYSSVTSFTKTRTSQDFSICRNTNARKTKPPKPSYNYSNSSEKGKTNHESNYISQYSPSGCSTTLKLYDDPWEIKKVLTASDLGKLNRLLLSSDSMAGLVNNNNNLHHHHNNDEEELRIKGRAVKVWDVETKSMHQLILKQWASFKNYGLIGNWNQDFVKRRNLKKGDEIGLQWDPYNFCFNFSVLRRSSIMG
ncbi:B3 domain-containing protein At2g33720-like [Neltuma alba]|uniref:B3 domain-containing protein At2g33720-like n=1 Tax=Neltuma alba TaxID=207710 RepID=UPI0010A2B622|nr:B3 domain-containing protein At2g33720-like [Prosopis alba]